MVIFTNSILAESSMQDVIEKCIKKYNPTAVYLREKHLLDGEYYALAKELLPLCDSYGVKFFICHRVDIARKLGVTNLHTNLETLSKIGTICDFNNISASIHSKREVGIAQNLGATSLVYGHIFKTDCKHNIQPRGLEQLKEICTLSDLPVIAIGGINRDNYKEVLQAGSQDFAIMSRAMTLTF